MMNLTIVNNRYINARDLCAKLHPHKRFRNYWVSILKWGFEEGIDYISVSTITESGQHQNDYLITLEMAKELCLLSKSELGRLYRKYLIKAEETLKEQQENLNYLDNHAYSVCASDIASHFHNCSAPVINQILLDEGWIELRASGYFPSPNRPNFVPAIKRVSMEPNDYWNYVRYNRQGESEVVKLLVQKGYELK